MSKISPTQRALALLRKEGHHCQIVEKWNAFAKVRVDLFECIDILALKKDLILGVQATSGSNSSARVNKSMACKGLRKWLEAGGRFEVWSFAKKGPRGKKKKWKVRKVELTLDSLDEEQEE